MSKTKKSTEENRELLKRYFDELQEYNEKITQKETNMREYCPKIMRNIASIEELVPDIKKIKYVKDIKKNLDGSFFEDDTYHKVVSEVGGILGFLEVILKDKIEKTK